VSCRLKWTASEDIMNTARNHTLYACLHHESGSFAPSFTHRRARALALVECELLCPHSSQASHSATCQSKGSEILAN
jgi:hypothetical protein